MKRRNRVELSQFAGRLKSLLTCAFLVAVHAAWGMAHAAECDPAPAPRIPAIKDFPVNIDDVKTALRNYRFSFYDDDIAAVVDSARRYVERRAPQVSKPAVVLDIDETSLSNWDNIAANDFGFIPAGTCDLPRPGACGFDAWILRSIAPAIVPTRDLFNVAIGKSVAVFFITARHNKQREATLLNLDREGYQGWTKLITRDDSDSNKSVQPFKTKEREKDRNVGIHDHRECRRSAERFRRSSCRQAHLRMFIQATESFLFHSLLSAPRACAVSFSSSQDC
jgi:HAD superfamily, subfamily IIIB (Acid phosphatase)